MKVDWDELKRLYEFRDQAYMDGVAWRDAIAQAFPAILAEREAAHAIPPGYALVRVEQVKDAERWQALLNCGRVKLQGWAGVDTKPGYLGHNDIGYVHFGAEFWTNAFEEKHYSAEAKAEAQKVLIAFADGAIKTAMLTAAAKGE